MKKGRFFGFNLLLVSVLFVSSTFAQDSPQWHLPKGVKARLGKGWISDIAYSPDGNLLAVATSIGVWIYNVHSGAELNLLTGHTSEIESVAFSPDGTTLASGGSWDDETVRLWDVPTGKHEATLVGHTSRISSVAFSPDGTTLASGGADETLQLWDARTGQSITTLTGHTGNVKSVVFSPDGATLASGSSDETIRLWHTTGEVKAILTGHASSINNLAFSPDGTTLASGSEDGTVLLWNLAPPTDTIPQVSAYDVNQDGIVNLVDLATVAELFGQTGEGLLGDINDDGVVNIFDLVTVSAHLDETATPAAPVVRRAHQLFFPTPIGVPITPETIQKWITMAHTADNGSFIFRRGIANLDALLAMLTPNETALLPNYPNPFNPETWIPYRLAHAADVTLAIYDTKGGAVRQLNLGYQPAGYYTDRTKAAYWDGRNDSGELVASGVYFYQLRAGDYTALRRMVILK